jgi:hypothetical protein
VVVGQGVDRGQLLVGQRWIERHVAGLQDAERQTNDDGVPDKHAAVGQYMDLVPVT